MNRARRIWRGRYLILYAALASGLILHLRHFHDARTGFSSLIVFGDAFQPRHISSLREVPIYTYARSDGYDGQFYAQMAVAGNPLHPDLRDALDSPPYRTKRLLLPLLAHVAGLGRPNWVIQVYALANAFCWLLLAILLARWWFPPTDLQNLIRWAGILFGEGMLSSITHSLIDGPALLVIAAGMHMVETNRQVVGARLLALAGLVRETSILCAAAFLPTSRDDLGRWRRALILGATVILPVLTWIGVLIAVYGGTGGLRNFHFPLFSYVRKLRELFQHWGAHGFDAGVRITLCAVISLGTQACFFIFRPKRADRWWRMGAAFCLLWLCLGEAVWEGSPAAATRVLLPLTLSFNVLAPRTKNGLILLLAGNLTIFSASDVLRPFVSEQNVFTKGVTSAYLTGWHSPESMGRRTWRWASGPAVLKFHNPNPYPVTVTIECRLTAVENRIVTLEGGGVDRSFAIPGGENGVSATVGPFPLVPGDTHLAFSSAGPPWIEPRPGGRQLTFALHDLYATVSDR